MGVKNRQLNKNRTANLFNRLIRKACNFIIYRKIFERQDKVFIFQYRYF